MFGLFEGTEARRLGRFQWPWRQIVLAVAILVAVGVVAYGVSEFVSRVGDNTAPAVSQPAAQPFDTTQGKPVQQVPQNVQENVDAAVPMVVENPPAQSAPQNIVSTVHPIEGMWKETNSDDPLYDGLTYYIWGLDVEGNIRNHMEGVRLVELLGTGETKDAIVYIKDFLTIGSSSEDHRDFQFSPDKGKTWFTPVSLPTDFTPSFRIQGAIWRGDDIIILANRQYKPWEYKHYVLRVTPQDLKRASR